MIAKFLQGWDIWYFTGENTFWDKITLFVSKIQDWVLLGGWRRWVAIICFCMFIISVKWLWEKWKRILERWDK